MQTLYHGFVHFNIHKAITYCQVDEIFRSNFAYGVLVYFFSQVMEKIMMDQTVIIIISI